MNQPQQTRGTRVTTEVHLPNRLPIAPPFSDLNAIDMLHDVAVDLFAQFGAEPRTNVATH